MQIDYVIAWVDGSDPAHRAARERFGALAAAHTTSAEETRFKDNGEIYFQIASVLKFAPFVSRIIIVSDNQLPPHLGSFFDEGLCAPEFVRIVSHDEMFDGLAASRPNFNSPSIEAALWRIPELSEHFIYANDDFFLCAPTCMEDYFVDGKPVIHGQWQRQLEQSLPRRIKRALRRLPMIPPRRPRLRLAFELGAALAGCRDRYLITDHHPHPLRRSTFAEFYAEHPEVLLRQLSFRFRSAEQYLPVALGNHLEIVRHGIVPQAPKKTAYFEPCMANFEEALAAVREGSVPCGCIQSLEEFSPDEGDRIRKIFTDMLRDYLPKALSAYGR